MADISISGLTTKPQADASDLVEVAAVDALSQTGYTSAKESLAAIGDLIANEMQFASDLQTTAKTLTGAINEAAQSGGGGGSEVVPNPQGEPTDTLDALEVDGDIYEIEKPESLYEVREATAGAVASFEAVDGGIPMDELKVSIVPVQSGTGDPSPSNVRPISGWTGATVTRTGKNMLDPSKWWSSVTEVGGIYTFITTGYQGDLYTGQNGASHVISPENRERLPLFKYGEYMFSTKQVSGGALSAVYAVDPNTGARTNISSATSEDGYNLVSFTVNKETKITICRTSNTAPTVFSEPMIEIGQARTAYEPYKGQTFTIDFGTAGTVFGGTLNVITGELAVTWGEIASYNGETLPGAWISDRDVYDPESTPTTGAQVVYELATPVTYQLTPQAVETLIGTNNVWADTGDVLSAKWHNGTKMSDVKAYVDSQINTLAPTATLLWSDDSGWGAVNTALNVPGISEWLFVAYAFYDNTNSFIMLGTPASGGNCTGLWSSNQVGTNGYRFAYNSTAETITVTSEDQGVYSENATTYSGSTNCKIYAIYGLIKKPVLTLSRSLQSAAPTLTKTPISLETGDLKKEVESIEGSDETDDLTDGEYVEI